MCELLALVTWLSANQFARWTHKLENRDCIGWCCSDGSLLPGLAHVCVVTDCMTIMRARIEMNIPRKRKGSCANHEKVCRVIIHEIIIPCIIVANYHWTDYCTSGCRSWKTSSLLCNSLSYFYHGAMTLRSSLVCAYPVWGNVQWLKSPPPKPPPPPFQCFLCSCSLPSIELSKSFVSHSSNRLNILFSLWWVSKWLSIPCISFYIFLSLSLRLCKDFTKQWCKLYCVMSGLMVGSSPSDMECWHRTHCLQYICTFYVVVKCILVASPGFVKVPSCLEGLCLAYRQPFVFCYFSLYDYRTSSTSMHSLRQWNKITEYSWKTSLSSCWWDNRT